tara:strand:- start:493 stop:2721 length:2229 start_codon:yes stop_codon:yes gene_type:complete
VNIIPKNTNILHKQSLKLSDDVVGQLDTVEFCSGFGAYHTNAPLKSDGTKRPDKDRKPYIGITLKGIRDLVDNPQQVDKTEAQWLIPSSYTGEWGRNAKHQQEQGLYHFLWADLDKNPPTIQAVWSEIESEFHCDQEVYTSRSATEEVQKSRVTIPLAKPLSGTDWVLAQICLNEWLVSKGITPDTANEKPSQVFYLPNRGTYYDSKSTRYDMPLDALAHFKDAIEEKKLAIEFYKRELVERIAAAKLKKEQRIAVGDDSPIDAFNDIYLTENVIDNYGYEQRGDKFRHSLSESGNYSLSIKNGRAHTLSTDDPLYTGGKGGGAHSAFSAFTVLQHNGDTEAAIKDICDNYLRIDSDSWNEVKQREYAIKKEKEKTEKLLGATPDGKIAPFDFNKFSLNGDSQAMKEKMLTDTYVLGELAVLGELTALYAKPNSGKTLLTIYLLIEAIKAGNIKAEDVYYINADDNYKGLVHKLELAEKHGFQMIAPGFKGFDTASFGFYLAQLMATNEAKGKVIILDTLKKFTNIMDKKLASDFGNQMREFVTNGGTIIMLAHTNKNRDADGKVVFSGTSDIVDDVDCAYTLDVNEDKSGAIDKVVLFENIKSRGDVAQEAAYKYTAKASNYQDLLDSVSPVDEGEAQLARERIRMDSLLNKNEDLIEVIIELIEGGTILKTELINKAIEQSGESKAKVRTALKEHTGKKFIDGHRWEEYKGKEAAKMYKVTKCGSDKFMYKGYEEAKNGE